MPSIVDVRSGNEYKQGHVQGSTNIPLQEIPQRIEEIKAMETPVILCCQSGFRSGQAEKYLLQQGVDCKNGGSWISCQNL